MVLRRAIDRSAAVIMLLTALLPLLVLGAMSLGARPRGDRMLNGAVDAVLFATQCLAAAAGLGLARSLLAPGRLPRPAAVLAPKLRGPQG